MPGLQILSEKLLRRTAIFFTLALLAGCGEDAMSPLAPGSPQNIRDGVSAADGQSAVLTWDDAAMQAIRLEKPAPTVVARSLAVLHTAIYDAWAPYDAKAVGTRPGEPGRRAPAERTDANKRKAVSFAAYRALVDLFPAEEAIFGATMSSLGYDAQDYSTDVTTPSGIGNAAAAAVLQWRHRDGSNQLGDLHPGAYSDYTGYAPVNTATHMNDPVRWQPLIVGGFTQKFATPQWGLVVPFALTSGSEFRPLEVRYQVSPEDLHMEIERILEYSRSLDDRRKMIAEYWADGPNSELPPGHWCLFASWVSAHNHYTLDQDVKLLFVVSNAVMDAGIAAWDAKRHFDSVRPVSAVHYFMAGQFVRAWAGPFQGMRRIRAEDWEPYQPSSVVTPPFSEFISGHSTFSAAAAEVLRRFTGSDAFGGSVTLRAGSSRVEPGVVPGRDITLSWRTFSDAADEAGISRRYGGIHFVEGDLAGRAIGRRVGAKVWEKAQQYFEGVVQ